jgi:hypothetical protein
MSGLSSGLPGLIAGPPSPPVCQLAFESSRNPAFCFSGPWHRMQCFTRSGRTFDSK